MTILEAALDYANKGMSVIPLDQKKVSLVKWEPHQKTKATTETIRQWWKKFPEANVGIVTGAISNLFVVDCDTAEAIQRIQDAIPESLPVPCETTPRGGRHFFFSHTEGFSNRAKVAEGIDIRTTGGYVAVAPSLNGNGRHWEWMTSILEVDPPDLALAVRDILINSLSFSLYRGNVDKKLTTKSISQQTSTLSTNVNMLFCEGRRNDDLFHIAHQLIKSKTAPDIISQVIENLGKSCEPPWGSQPDDGSILKILESAEKFSKKRDRNLHDEVREWVLSTEGDFLSSECQRSLHLSTREETQNLHMILKRLSQGEKPLIQKKGTRRGSWTTIQRTTREMDFVNINLNNTVPLTMPLDIHNKTIFFPKSIIIIAGVTGFGKSTFALRFIADNMNKFKIWYFNSEMSPEALHRKLSYFRDIRIMDWTMKAIDGWDYKTIANEIHPNDVNVIDYLEPEGDKPYGIHGVISDIVNHLDQGIALITIQKKPGASLGTGGIYSVKAASLALNMEWGNIKVFKNRFREEDNQPWNDAIDFDIVEGSKFQEKGGWYDSRSGKTKPGRYKDFDGN